MSNEELARLIQNIIRVGTIMGVDHAGQLVRVKTGDLETDWRPWLERRAGATKTWDPPTPGEQVVLLCPGGDLSAAYVLAAVNSDSNSAPSDSPAETVRLFPDGALLKYDHNAGALSFTGIKTFSVDAADSITLKASEITLDAPQTVSTGKHTIEGLLTYLAGMAGFNGSTGATKITGSITHTGGDLSSNGVIVHLHVHGGVLSGGADTDIPK